MPGLSFLSFIDERSSTRLCRRCLRIKLLRKPCGTKCVRESQKFAQYHERRAIISWKLVLQMYFVWSHLNVAHGIVGRRSKSITISFHPILMTCLIENCTYSTFQDVSWLEYRIRWFRSCTVMPLMHINQNAHLLPEIWNILHPYLSEYSWWWRARLHSNELSIYAHELLSQNALVLVDCGQFTRPCERSDWSGTYENREQLHHHQQSYWSLDALVNWLDTGDRGKIKTSNPKTVNYMSSLIYADGMKITSSTKATQQQHNKVSASPAKYPGAWITPICTITLKRWPTNPTGRMVEAHNIEPTHPKTKDGHW